MAKVIEDPLTPEMDLLIKQSVNTIKQITAAVWTTFPASSRDTDQMRVLIDAVQRELHFRITNGPVAVGVPAPVVEAKGSTAEKAPDPEALCVSIARWLLAQISGRRTLAINIAQGAEKSEAWKDFKQFCSRNGLYAAHPDVFIPVLVTDFRFAPPPPGYHIYCWPSVEQLERICCEVLTGQIKKGGEPAPTEVANPGTMAISIARWLTARLENKSAIEVKLDGAGVEKSLAWIDFKDFCGYNDLYFGHHGMFTATLVSEFNFVFNRTSEKYEPSSLGRLAELCASRVKS